MIAINGDGDSLPGLANDVTTPVLYMQKPTAPPPSLAAATIDNYSIRVTWATYPATAAGDIERGYSPITGYTVYYRKKLGSDPWVSANADPETTDITTVGSVVSYDKTGLVPHLEYEFTVKAHNAFGFGITHIDANAVSDTTFGTPFAPAKPTLTQEFGSKDILIEWPAHTPAQMGGAPITSYTLYVMNGTTAVNATATCHEHVDNSDDLLYARACTLTMAEIKAIYTTGAVGADI